MNKTYEEMYRLVDSYSDMASRINETEHIVDDLLAEKIEMVGDIVIEDEKILDDARLKKIAENNFIDKLYWYSPEGEVIYSKDGDNIGWKSYEGHPVHDFLKSGDMVSVGEIRDDTISGKGYKYGYIRSEEGYFVQVGISAEHIYSLLDSFSLDSFAKQLCQKDYIERAYFTKKLPQGEEDEYSKVIISNSELGSRSNNFYFEKPYKEGKNHEIAFPIYENGKNSGYLNVIHSMGETERIIRKVSIIGAITIVVVFGTLISSIAYMYRSKKDLETLLYYDTLTGLPNKKLLREVIKKQIEDKSENRSAVILINIIKFKYINSIFGYDDGDKVLLETVARIKRATEIESIYRLSDDRFILYIEKFQDDNMLDCICQKLINAFRIEFNISNISKKIDIKMGALELEREHESFNQVMKDLSIALENIDKNEANSYCFFDNSMKERILRDEHIERALKNSIESDDNEVFYLEYQPQIDLKSGRTVGFEALARMNTNDLGYVPPLEFIKVAEERQLIIPLGINIIKGACRFLAYLESIGHKDIKIAVNLSVIQIMWGDLVPTVRNIIHETGINPFNLEFEITESMFDDNYSEVNSILEKFRSKGVKISIDDFGTGYSSLAKINELNVDTLKIDKIFTDGILNDEKPIIEDIISLAHNLDMNVVVEGVENEEQRNYLMDKGCDIVQGYFFGKPLSEVDAVAFLE